MDTVLIIIIALIIAIGLFAAYRIVKVKAQSRKHNEERLKRLMPLYDKLQAGEALTAAEVLPFAENPLTRCDTFLLLRQYNQPEKFPEAYLSLIKGAEGALARWLEFPTELGACPDEIEYIKRVTFDFDGKNNFVHYEVFKYRLNPPHWAANKAWILGVVGPYFDDSKPYDAAKATFSRADSTAALVTPEQEAKWVHENISKRR